MGKKSKSNVPRRKRMKRPGRLAMAKKWVGTYEGKRIVRAYSRCYGVNNLCAVVELQQLGVIIDPEFVKQLHIDEENRRKARQQRRAMLELVDPDPSWDEYYVDEADDTPSIEQEIDFGCECPESYENDLELYEFPFETCQLCGSGPLYFVEEFGPESEERSVCTNCWYQIIHTENDFEEYGDE